MHRTDRIVATILCLAALALLLFTMNVIAGAASAAAHELTKPPATLTMPLTAIDSFDAEALTTAEKIEAGSIYVIDLRN